MPKQSVPSADKPFWVKPTDRHPERAYATYKEAEKYARRWVHKLKGAEVRIIGPVGLVACCRRSNRRRATSFLTEAGSRIV